MPTVPPLVALVAALAAVLAVLVTVLLRRERGAAVDAEALLARLRERTDALRAHQATLADRARLPEPAVAPADASRSVADGSARPAPRRTDEPRRGARVPPPGRPREPRPAQRGS